MPGDEREIFSVDFASAEVQEITEVNPTFAKGKLWLAYAGDNRNGSSIPKEVFTDALPTIFNIPVVARYIEGDEGDLGSLGGHDSTISIVDGKIVRKFLTQPVGVVPSGAEVTWETKEDPDGVEREYMCIDIILWRRCDAFPLIESLGIVPESFECFFDKWHYAEDSKTRIVDAMTFLAVCLIGKEPCYEGAQVALYERDDFMASLKTMYSELQEAGILVKAPVAELFKKGEKGAVFTKENLELLLAKYDLPESEVDFEWSEESNPEDVERSIASLSFKAHANKVFAEHQTYKEKYGLIADSLPNECEYAPATEECPYPTVIKQTYYYLCDFDENFVYCTKYVYERQESGDTKSDEKKCRIRYEISSNGVVYGEEEEMVVTWLTLDEFAAIEADRNLCASLKDFKLKTERAELEGRYKGVISNFAELEGVAEFKELCDKINYDADEVVAFEKECYALVGKRNRDAGGSAKVPFIMIPAENKTHSAGVATEKKDLFEKFTKR